MLLVALSGVQCGWKVSRPFAGKANSPVAASILGTMAASKVLLAEVSGSNHQAVPARTWSSPSMICESQ